MSTEFFEAVRADHHVISRDGEHENPDLETLRMILDARGAVGVATIGVAR